MCNVQAKACTHLRNNNGKQKAGSSATLRMTKKSDVILRVAGAGCAI